MFVAMRPVGKPVHNVYPFVQLQTDSSLADCSLQHMYALRSELLVFGRCVGINAKYIGRFPYGFSAMVSSCIRVAR